MAFNYELFHEALSDPAGPKLLVRAEHDRVLADGQGHLWDHVKGQPLAGRQEVQVPRRGNRPARVAQLEIRFAAVKLKPPKSKKALAQVRQLTKLKSIFTGKILKSLHYKS